MPFVARADEVEVLVHDGIRQPAAPVEDADDQPLLGRHRPAARQQPIGDIGAQRSVRIRPDDGRHHHVVIRRERIEIAARDRPHVRHVQVDAVVVSEVHAGFGLAVRRLSGALEEQLAAAHGA